MVCLTEVLAQRYRLRTTGVRSERRSGAKECESEEERLEDAERSTLSSVEGTGLDMVATSGRIAKTRELLLPDTQVGPWWLQSKLQLQASTSGGAHSERSSVGWIVGAFLKRGAREQYRNVQR